jgi:hypothetical protein
MVNRDLKLALSELSISQVDLARLVGVTTRAVAMWMAGDREVPGAVEAYVRLLGSLTAAQRQVELARAKDRRTMMRDGMYGVEYDTSQGSGMACLVLDTGRVYGADPMGGKYDGEYVYDETSGLADLSLKVTMPPNVLSVLGIKNPYEWSIDVRTKLNPKMDSGSLEVATSVGKPISATYRFLRPLPAA